MKPIRPSEDRFDSIPGYPHPPKYVDWDGIRIAYVDEGSGPTVLLLHGMPTWGFLWRDVIGPLLEAGYRCVVPDMPGFGRSDKPDDVDWYTYDRMTASVRAFFELLDLDDVTLVVHDWGGPIGLRVATTEIPERISRLTVMDTGIFTGHQKMSDAWLHFKDFVAGNEDLPIEPLIAGGCAKDPGPEVLAAYGVAPFPTVGSKAGARTLPGLIPLTPDSPGAAEGQAASEKLRADTRPSLLLWADSDPVLPLEPIGRAAQALVPTAAPLTVIENAGHFLQEDQGEVIGRHIAEWLRGLDGPATG